MSIGSTRLSKVEISPILTAIKLKETNPNLVCLNQGIPEFKTPEHILSAAVKAIHDNLVGEYSDTSGIPELREAICNHFINNKNALISPANIIATTGASEGIMLALLLLGDPDDEVFLMSPTYASHLDQVYLAGMRPVFLPMEIRDNHWFFDPITLEDSIKEKNRRGHVKPKGIILCNPNNPTGFVFNMQVLLEIGKIAKHYGLFIIIDETYEDFIFDGVSPFSLASVDEVKDICVSCYSFSKSYAMTGWRIGYLVIPNSLIDLAKVIHDDLAICAPVVSQYAATAALTGSKDHLKNYLLKLDSQRKFMIKASEQINHLKMVIGQGSIFLFPELVPPRDSEIYTRQLVEEAKVLVVPGKGFGPTGLNHVRLSFTNSELNIKEAFLRLQVWDKALLG